MMWTTSKCSFETHHFFFFFFLFAFFVRPAGDNDVQNLRIHTKFIIFHVEDGGLDNWILYMKVSWDWVLGKSYSFLYYFKIWLNSTLMSNNLSFVWALTWTQLLVQLCSFVMRFLIHFAVKVVMKQIFFFFLTKEPALD